MRKQFLSLTVLAFVPTTWAVPIPTAVTGDIEEGNTITIDGSNFGDGPNLIVFDNFEKGTEGEEVSLNNATVGRWADSENSPVYIREGARSGQMAMLVSDSDYREGMARKVTAAAEAGPADESYHDDLMAFQEVFFSFAVKDLGSFPGQGGGPDRYSNDSAVKDAWMMLGPRGDNTALSGQGHDLYIPAWANNFLISGNNSRNTSYWLNDLRDKWSFGGWNVLSFYGKVDPDHPYSGSTGFFRYINDNGIGRQGPEEELMFEKNGVPSFWDRVKFGAWYRETPSGVRRIMDDIYVAVGPNAQARVELGNAPTYSESTKFALLTPTQWSPSTIKATVHTGDFAATELSSLYVYVIDGEGNVHDKGLAACPQCPQPAKILSD